MKTPLKKNKNLKKITVYILLAVLFIFLANFYQKEIKNLFYSVSAPLQRTLWKAGDKMSDFLETVSEIKYLKRKNEELELKVQELLAENTILKESKKENEILREALKVGLEKEFNLILARVTGKDISQDSLIIDMGSKDGLKKNLPVITPQKNLVGKISDVYEDFSRVMLVSSKESSFDGKTSACGPADCDDEIYGVVKGRGNLEISFELLPKEKEIKEKEPVVTSSLGGLFPGGLLVGEIEKVKKSDTEPFQEAELSLLFDIKEIDILFIITGF